EFVGGVHVRVVPSGTVFLIEESNEVTKTQFGNIIVKSDVTKTQFGNIIVISEATKTHMSHAAKEVVNTDVGVV
ncbi:hypothetical protein DPMN_183315, partial [Dreissena polymorpha]